MADIEVGRSCSSFGSNMKPKFPDLDGSSSGEGGDAENKHTHTHKHKHKHKHPTAVAEAELCGPAEPSSPPARRRLLTTPTRRGYFACRAISILRPNLLPPAPIVIGTPMARPSLPIELSPKLACRV